MSCKEEKMILSSRLGLHICSKGNSVSPSVKPLSSSLSVEYNGLNLLIKVKGESIHTCVSSWEGSFCLDVIQEYSGQFTWGEILQGSITESVAHLTLLAMNQSELMKSGRKFYAQ